MKVRPNRIGEEIKKELVQLIRNGVKDPRVDSLISITDVEVTRDLSYATVYISRYGNEQQRRDALDGMKAAAGFLRSELSRRLKLRTVPELIFKLDDSLEYGAKIETILNQIRQEQ
ncbi:MAG: 30S ribosome-binding factor RbfA [Peptococcaceae bacterium]